VTVSGGGVRCDDEAISLCGALTSRAAILDIKNRAAGEFNLTSTARSLDLERSHGRDEDVFFAATASNPHAGFRRRSPARSMFGPTTLSLAGTKGSRHRGLNITRHVQRSDRPDGHVHCA